MLDQRLRNQQKQLIREPAQAPKTCKDGGARTQSHTTFPKHTCTINSQHCHDENAFGITRLTLLSK
jgi:hypothetical protein